MKKKVISLFLFLSVFSLYGTSDNSMQVSKKALVAAKSLIVKATTFFDGAYIAFAAIVEGDEDGKNGKKIADYLLGDYLKGLKELALIGRNAEKRYPDFKKAAKDRSLKKKTDLLRASVMKLGMIFRKIQRIYGNNKEYQEAFKKFKKLLKESNK